MAPSGTLKVSYCTTCKGRLHHLMGNPNAPVGTLEHDGTLRRNLEAEKNNPNVEFVVLSYGKDPEMDAFMHNFDAEIASGRIKYAVYPAAVDFKMAHAKNMAHRLATGDILCNLDADNGIVTDYSRWLTQQFLSNPDTIVSHKVVTLKDDVRARITSRLLKQPRALNSAGGFIALSADNYRRLNGYDENYSGWGGDDYNLTRRARQSGMDTIAPPKALWGEVIDHGMEERLENLSHADRQDSEKLLRRSKAATLVAAAKRHLAKPNMEVNEGGHTGCGMVYVNFSDTPTSVLPLGTTEKIVKARGSAEPYNAVPLKNNWHEDVVEQKEQKKREAFPRL